VGDLAREGLVERRAGSGTYVRAEHVRDVSAGLSFGLLIPELGQTDIFEPICQGMAEAPQAQGHALLWLNRTQGGGDASRSEQAWQLCQECLRREVAGVFFAPGEKLGRSDTTNHRIANVLEQAGIPIVLLDRDFLPYPGRSRYDLVGIDNRRTGFSATEHLINAGARRVAFVSFPGGPSTIDERIAGYREALLMHGVPVEPGLAQRLRSDDRESVRRWRKEQRPDAVVCVNDFTAARLMQSLLELGVQIPAQVRMVGIDDNPYASLLPVPLTTMHQPCREIGLAAMAAMIERLARPTMPGREILLECPLMVRKSCGAQAAR
jgi:DNA-binding LacI/PurR family transcriptional regulator